jgi:hypothetical protein
MHEANDEFAAVLQDRSPAKKIRIRTVLAAAALASKMHATRL